jgi:hypothetical protein
LQYLPPLPQEPLAIAVIDAAERDRLEAVEREMRSIRQYLDDCVTDLDLLASGPLRTIERKTARALGLPSRMGPVNR